MKTTEQQVSTLCLATILLKEKIVWKVKVKEQTDSVRKC